MVKIILATGGTGGHIFPATSLAKELKLRNYQPIIIADVRYLNYIKNQPEVSYNIINSGTFSSNFKNNITAATKITIGIFQAIMLLIKHKPKLVIGFGGYPSFPTIFAAILLNIPVILHEQNCYLGKVNKIFLKFSKVLASSFNRLYNTPSGIISNLPSLDQIQSHDKIIWTGNPVREEIVKISNIPYPNFTLEQLNILVIGGSQGARIFSEVIPKSIAALPPDIQKKIYITQQCGVNELDEVKALYNTTLAKSELANFFDDMPVKFKDCHLVISRAGASTIAELSQVGRPAILVPYPYFGNHQKYNAYDVEERKAGWIIVQNNFNTTSLNSLLLSFFTNSDLLNEAATNAKSLQNNASKNLANLIEKIVKGKI